ncbi:MAG: AMP-dependent synthetase [Deltaproteobacteria bacterium HGW-Deltaproteobacteria-13]|jgi:crotonobetaine/carnitine-CoA ligase|nr:MAG: AMP-dependent synthetase [Deltaproteobacteria bacterium HGW-Deltaproteobacteria-13]
MYLLANSKIVFSMVKSLLIFFKDEIGRGTFRANFRSLIKTKEIAEDMSWAELIEEKARKYGDRTFLIYEDKQFSFRQMDENANRVANYLLSLGAGKGKGVAIIMANCPQYLDVYIGSQKIGMYSIPINTSLRGDSLLYILNHSDAEFVVIDEEFLDIYNKIADKIEKRKTVIVNRTAPVSSSSLPKGMLPLSHASAKPAQNPNIKYDKDDICFILYTSGTTGLPKGVMYRYAKTTLKLLSLPANALYKKSDILYTSLPLFHGNALWLCVTQAMHRGCKVVLARKFSASKFWDEIRKYKVTEFNTIGAMIPILMKQPPRENDNINNVRFTLSAACPVDDWEKFEKRFGIKIYEAYGSVDGGGKSIMNLGNAPVGSIGKPAPNTVYRLVDNEGKDVPDGTPGQLIFESKGKKKSVEYFKNEKAGNDKLKDGWIYTGDLVRRDKNGYLYFVGRNAEFMRIKGENVSAYEVEHTIQKHPSVLEAAVYAVPSELAEDEIMACVSLVDGHTLKEADLVETLKEDLAKFAVPRFVKIVKEFPKTETQRIIKKELEKKGIIAGTYDAQRNQYVEAKAL